MVCIWTRTEIFWKLLFFYFFIGENCTYSQLINLALNQEIVHSPLYNYFNYNYHHINNQRFEQISNNPTDGDTRPFRCMMTAPQNRIEFIGVELNQTYTINYVLLYMNFRHRNQQYLLNHKIYVGNVFYDTYDYGVENFEECLNTESFGFRKYLNTSNVFYAKCENNPKGKYVILSRQKDYDLNAFSQNNLQTQHRTSVCEMQVYSLDQVKMNLPSQVEDKSKLIEDSIPHIKNVREQLWKDVKNIYLGKYLAGIWAIDNDTIPFAWDLNKRQTFAVAIEKEKGRAFALPNELAKFLLTNRNPEKLSIIERNWNGYLFNQVISQNDNDMKIHWIECDSLHIKNPNYNDGYIYRPSCMNFDPEKVFREFKTGKRSPIILIHSGWKSESKRYKDGPFFKLAKLMGVQFLNTVINWQPKNFMTNIFTTEEDDFLSLESMLIIGLGNKTKFSRFTSFPDFSISLKQHKVLLKDHENIAQLIENVVTNYTKLLETFVSAMGNPIELNLDASKEFPRGCLFNLNRLGFSQSLKSIDYQLPLIERFPGAYIDPDESSVKIISINNEHGKEVHSLGLFLGTRQTFTYKVLYYTGEIEDWTIQIGCHTDRLINQRAFRRLPLISHSIEMEEEAEVFSPIGGLLYLKNRRQIRGSITLKFNGLSQAPYFNLRDNRTHFAWNNSIYNDSQIPWSDISGDMITFCYPTRLVRNLNLDQLIQLTEGHWDRVVKSDIKFIGKNPINFMRQRVVFDIQLTMGYGHSGYPIVGQRDWAEKSLSILYDDGSRVDNYWGLAHEIGHNFQDPAWTMELFKETSNNVMVLMNYQFIFNHSLNHGQFTRGIFDNESLRIVLKHLHDFLVSETNLTRVYIQYFAQLIRHFDFGLIYQAWGRYSIEFDKNLKKNYTMEDWIEILSKVSGYDMIPFHKLWKFNFNPELISQDIQSMPCFLPNDWLSNHINDLVKKVEIDYGRVCVKNVDKIPLPEDIFANFNETQPLRVIHLT